MRLLVGAAFLVLGASSASAHHISGFVYCDENSSATIDAGDRPLDGVMVRATSLTAVPGQQFSDLTGDDVPVAGGPGAYWMYLPARTEDYEVKIVSGLPVGATVIGPAGGTYPSLPIITGNSVTDRQENVNFLVDGCQICGDGDVDPGEECDDGNDVDTDACRNDCTAPVCGDGIEDAGEQCDDGNQVDTDACRNDCTLPRCGDGVQDPGEQCDDGNQIDTDACRNDCTIPVCGDGVQDPGEECDDGNRENDDACRNDCTTPKCGDGIVDPELGEQCEPPNSPGCDANCHPAEICTDLVDNDDDGDIDCLDSDCDCLPIGRDPGVIRFGKPGDGDLFAVHGALAPTSSVDPTVEPVSFLLSNADGVVFKLTIPAGQVKKVGRNRFRFRDRIAQRTRSGLARFDLRHFPQRGNYTFVVKAYGDLSKATLADMAVQVVVGNDPFLNQSTWLKLPRGWLLVLPRP